MRRSSAPLAYFAAGAASVAAASLLYSSAQSPKQKILPSPRSNEQKIAPPYAKADYIPGGRDISTPYGNLRVYESGPEDADRKVLLIHGISTPCVSVAGIGENLASKGCRVMLLDLFGRGWSDAPGDLKFDDRLYTTQILLAITSSSLHWSRFTLIGYSMGAGISANFTSYFPSMVEDLVLLAPAGLIRTSHLDWKTKATYSGWLPEWLVERLVKNRLRTSPNVKTTMRPQTALPTEQGSDPIAAETAAGRGKGGVKPMAFGRAVDAEAVVRWQMDNHAGFVPAYYSSFADAPVRQQHERWRMIRASELRTGKVLLVLGKNDRAVFSDELEVDVPEVLGRENVRIKSFDAGHEVPITYATQIAEWIWEQWTAG